MILKQFPPMGVYETLFKFLDATAKYMGDPGTHPWAQGYPLTKQLPGGPPLPSCIELTYTDLKYPKATGELVLREALSNYYNRFYDAGITADHVAVFAGGRAGILATLLILKRGTSIVLEATEYTPYYDMLRLLNHDVHLIPCNGENRFRPTIEEYAESVAQITGDVMLVKSNPCNPTGVMSAGNDLRERVQMFTGENRAALFDEAYEFYSEPEPESALQHINDIDSTNIFVVGAATKGLQVPGMRTGWVIAAKKHIEIFRNYSSFGMGGVSRPSQIYVTGLLEPKRVEQARDAVNRYFAWQRERYGDALRELGVELFTGNGGFYHWGKLPGRLTAEKFNDRLFEHDAGILPGRFCDMSREVGKPSSLDRFFRFSFGPLEADSFESDMCILRDCLA
jgi:aspartate/methionine/tyrosine aminotransferase